VTKSHHILMLPVADERGASTRYRVLAYRETLEQAGFTTEVRFPLGAGKRGPARVALRAADILRDVYGESDADLVFVHRKTYPFPLVPRLRREGRPLVFDMDDALDLPPPGAGVGDLSRERYRRNFHATVEAADLVICGNQYLASRLPHDRYDVLPTPIDTRRFSPERVSPPPGPTVGWVGYSDNLGYLESLAGVLREVSRRHPGLRLVVVADRPPDIRGVEVEFREWSLETEVSGFNGIGVGLMPLPDNPWTLGKCAFKAIQYMSLGIPAVASPVGMNLEVIDDGRNGFLPDGETDWIEVLDRLLKDPGKAREIGAEGRRTIERRYALEVVSEQMVEILSSLFHDGAEAQWWHGSSDGLAL
jgi:glycosyltransferase involved in cell wall biosynthesis